jgi:iron complex outermembrane receptor protein
MLQQYSSLADVKSSSYNYLRKSRKKCLTNQFSGFEYFSDLFIEDASFLRMDNLSVGYNFGDFLGKKVILELLQWHKMYS